MARVLVVDDARFMRMMLSNVLVEDEHEIVGEAENAKQAVDMFRELKPDIVTLDIVMPEVDGITSLEAIKAILKESSKAQILMVSAMGQKDIMMECLQAGAKDFIVKPFDPKKIKQTVKRLTAA